MIMFFSLGTLISFSKEQALTPFFAWAVTVALLGYQLKWVNIAAFVFGLYFVVTYLVPYAQYGRSYQGETSPFALAGYMLTHMDEVRQSYADTEQLLGNVHYYDQRLSLLNRLDFISVDSALIDVADRQGPLGYRPIYEGALNVIPHVFYPNKPVPFWGNLYAHEIGIIPYDDFTTGVSFSPSADAYREGGIKGVLIAEPLMLLVVFLILDSFIGDVRLNPVGLLTTILVSRASSEGALWGLPPVAGQSLITNMIAVYVCAYALPLIGSIFNQQFLHAPPGDLTPGPADTALPSPVPTS
jgi:hypothetical protein